MEVRIEQKDLQILDTGGRVKPTNMPFGYVAEFNPSNPDDVVEVLIHDENQNFLERGVVDSSDVLFSTDGVRLKTGVILRKFGYDRGRYVVKYNFLRNLAGSDETVLVDDNGDIYDGDFHVMPDGTIMDGESHEDSEGIILRLLELKYFIQEISGTRREIRILPQEIKDIEYINRFLSLPSGNRRLKIKNNSVKFKVDAQGSTLAGQSLSLEFQNNSSVIPEMKGGLIYLNNAYVESETKQVSQQDLDTRIEELDSTTTQARFLIIADNGREFKGDKSFKNIHNLLSPLSEADSLSPNQFGNNSLSFEGDGRSFRDVRWLNENIFQKVNFTAEGGGAESPVIVTLRSISERPQNVAFLYEWEFFGYDKQGNKYNKITPKIPGTDGGEIFIPSQPNSLSTSGTDLKELQVHIYGDVIRVGVRLKISSKDGLVSEVFYPACMEAN